MFARRRSPDRISWRDYQKSNRRGRGPAKILKLFVAVCVVAAIGFGILNGAELLISRIQLSSILSAGKTTGLSNVSPGKDTAVRMVEKALLNTRLPVFTAQVDGKPYSIDTSIDPDLQGSILSKVEEMTSKDRYRSRFIGIVVMKPDTGKVLSMVSFDKEVPDRNICVNSRLPAASIFKIVTAAAAIEAHGLSAESAVNYTGRKHTLYRGQLKDTKPRYTNTVTLEDSFAQSVNPAFGKIGVGMLGKQEIEDFAQRFGFNQEIKFDIPVEQSRVLVADEPYRLAEIASGFNTQTTITPLHGALICSAILNGGQMKDPAVVERISGPSGRSIYEHKDTPAKRVISERASRELYRMMMATISNGTARKMFRGHNRNPVLKELNIGGKTGSINNNPKIDWFVGFAENPRTRNGIVISAVVAHEDFIGEKAGQYARIAMESYFSRESGRTK